MNQGFNNGNTTNRFIFSDDFYNQLESSQEIVKADIKIEEPTIMPTVEPIKQEFVANEINSVFTNSPVLENNENMIETTVNEVLDDEVHVDTLDNNQIANDNVVSNNNEVNNIEENKEELVQTIKVEDTNDFEFVPPINKNVEQEVMKINAENHSRPAIIEKGSWYEEPTEKQVYRAVRNKPQTNPIVYNNDYKEPTIIKTNPQVEEINKLFKQPPVVNIDELLRQEILIEEKKQRELQKELEKNAPAIKSDLLTRLRKKEMETGKVSILARYGDDFCERDYITNPAIGRDKEIKELILILLAPEKSGILVGKPGIGKTAIVEGLAYRLQRNLVPDVLKGYCIVSVKTTSLLGTLPSGETRLQTLIDELKELDKIILFIDEIHMLMGATKESSMDFANMFKESLGRGSIKMIGATTNDEYERYVLRDKAFVRRFQRVDVEEPSREQTIEILMGSLPKLEKNIGVKLNYSEYIKIEIMGFIVDITTEYKRVYGIGSRYPDICLTLLTQAFSQAVFDNRKKVNILDIRNAIENSKNIYPDVIRKELINFDNKFKQLIEEEKAM